ncbi:MAG TPA: M15 family metallopeptidase [Chthoniobacterales bacterium]|nr:M15 family metallopeptidase [Chthoniobacterales bacterium]
MKPPNGRKEIEAMFGNPANADGTLNEAWEGANIRKIAPPDGWQLFYQDDKRGLVPVSGIRMHKLLEDVFHAVLDDIWAFATQQIGGKPSQDDIRSWLHKRRLDQHGGGFNFRRITGGGSLSLHSYGIAIDWDPDHNPRQKPLKKTLPDWWYDLWAKQGWSDGRHFKTPDPMHVQFATGA